MDSKRLTVDEFKHRPLAGLMSIKKEEISNVDIFGAISYAEEKINASPTGRTGDLALLFYFIKTLQDLGFDFIVKGGLILQYYLADRARPTKDVDILLFEDCDAFNDRLEEALEKQEGPIKFEIEFYARLDANKHYYYDTFTYTIGVTNNGEPIGDFIFEGVVYPKGIDVKTLIYDGPELIKENFKFKGVPIEYVMAEKVIASTNDLVRPYKHLVDLYSLIHIDINLSLLKKYLQDIIAKDNIVRERFNKPQFNNNFVVRGEKEFEESYVLPLLQAGYNLPFEEVKDVVDKWLKENL